MELHNQQRQDDCLEGYSKAEILELKMQMQHKYDDELKRITEMLESKLKEENMNLLRQLAEEQAAKLKAEKNAKSANIKLYKIRKLRQVLAVANSSRCVIM